MGVGDSSVGVGTAQWGWEQLSESGDSSVGEGTAQ